MRPPSIAGPSVGTDGTSKPAWTNASHTDAERLPITAALEGMASRGHDGIRAWAKTLFRNWEVFEVKVEEIRTLGGARILALGNWGARGRGSGLELGQQAAWLTVFRDGKMIRMQTFTDRGKALEAADARG